MSRQHPCQKVGWVGAVIKVQSAQKQSRASGSYLLCLRAYRKKTQKGEESAVCWAPSVPSGNSQARGRARAAWRRPNLEAPTIAVVVWSGLCWHGHQTQCICKALRSCHQQQTSMLAAQEAAECLFFCFFFQNHH